MTWVNSPWPRDVVLLIGGRCDEFYFRAPEEQLDQAEAYPFMTPIFGKGVVFDVPRERRREMLHNQALRDKFMRATPPPSPTRWSRWWPAGTTKAKSTS